MWRNALLWLCLLLVPLGTAVAKDGRPAANNAAKAAPQRQETKPDEAKELSGMSIVGNDEVPKSLYIVPWKSSEIGVETNMNMLLNENAAPVDREVFMRQLNFYEMSTKK